MGEGSLFAIETCRANGSEKELRTGGWVLKCGNMVVRSEAKGGGGERKKI